MNRQEGGGCAHIVAQWTNTQFFLGQTDQPTNRVLDSFFLWMNTFYEIQERIDMIIIILLQFGEGAEL